MARKAWKIIISPAFLLAAIILLDVLLRARFLGHLMGVDEAKNYLGVTTIVQGYPGAPFNTVFYFHPPLYLTGAVCVFSLFSSWGERSLEMYSILLSGLSVLVLYLLGKEIYNRWAGLISAFIYAVLPAAMIMDGWVKADLPEVLFSLLFLLFFLKKRKEWAALFLALAFLSKETVLLPLAGLAVYLLITWDRRQLKDFAFCLIVAVLLSWWWYAFLSYGRGKMLQFFLGYHPETSYFESGFFYFISGMPADYGILPLALITVGGISTAARAFKVRDRELLPLTCFLVPYLILSLLPAKPPWMITAVIPFAALLGGTGCERIIRFLSAYGRATAGVALAGIILTLFLVAAFTSYAGYMDDRQRIFYDFSKDMRREAVSIGSYLGEDTGTLFFFGEGNFPQAVFLLYFQPEPLYFTMGEEDCQELVDVVRQEDLDAAVLMKGEKGYEIAACLYENEGFVFRETGYFLVGTRRNRQSREDAGELASADPL